MNPRSPDSVLELPSVWSGGSLAGETWVRWLADEEMASLARIATDVAATLDGDPGRLRHTPAATLTARPLLALARELKHELVAGRGFAVLRGLPVHRWSRLETVAAYWALGHALGTPRPSNAHGDLLGHVVDTGADYADPSVRGYQTRATLTHHCDNCSIVALLCLRTARRGGESMIASCPAIWNTFAQRRPDLLEALQMPYCWSRLGEQAPGEGPWYKAPLVQFVDGVFHCAAASDHIRKGHALPGAPPLRPAQDEALQLFDAMAGELEFSMWLEPGDVQLLNNALVVHRRAGYEDWPQPGRRRHLLRLWLDDPEMHRGATFFDLCRRGILAGEGRARITLDVLPAAERSRTGPP
jgi:hypothetical protein